ncbi:amidohydrolase family protein [Streptomyces sp. A5-4]|uniref:amidohydrolase family protein n=1 Tax=Streptomyces sp. A5-4 TaxID=3384771 RepID=UPI003DA94CDC
MPTRREAFATATARTDSAPFPHDETGPHPSPVLALTHATLIDPYTDGAASRAAAEDRTLLISDGRITCTGPSAQLPVPRGARTIDLTGKYVIPGLVESHVHSTGSATVESPLFPLNGVTATRQMWGLPLHHRWREEISAGRLLGPRMVIAGVMLDGAPSLWTDDTGQELIEVADAMAARRAVRRVKREGADFVKVYSRLTFAAYSAVADEARLQNIPYAGHCPDQVTVAQASAAGQQTIEHLHALVLATASPRHRVTASPRHARRRESSGRPCSASRWTRRSRRALPGTRVGSAGSKHWSGKRYARTTPGGPTPCSTCSPRKARVSSRRSACTTPWSVRTNCPPPPRSGSTSRPGRSGAGR